MCMGAACWSEQQGGNLVRKLLICYTAPPRLIVHQVALLEPAFQNHQRKQPFQSLIRACLPRVAAAQRLCAHMCLLLHRLRRMLLQPLRLPRLLLLVLLFLRLLLLLFLLWILVLRRLLLLAGRNQRIQLRGAAGVGVHCHGAKIWEPDRLGR